MDSARTKKLRKNFRLMFWIQALSEIKVFNVISTIFYVHRGLTLSQTFYLAIAFSIVSVISEVPSSYLADKWSRKGLIIVALLIGVVYWSFNLVAFGVVAMLIGNSLYALAYSIMSGTDEALVYDTAKELGEETSSRKKLSVFFSSQRIFKIVTPLVAVLLAKDLSNDQFMFIIAIDIVANLLALILADQLTEPNHYRRLELAEVGLVKGAIILLKSSPRLFAAMVNRAVFFIASFAAWRVSSEYFVHLGVPVIILGLFACSYQLAMFVLNMKSHDWFEKWSNESIINVLNYINIVAFALLAFNELSIHLPIVALAAFWIVSVSEVIRWPFFSDIFNKYSYSQNRATTLSIANMLGSILQIPVFIFGSMLISVGYAYLFGFGLVLIVLTQTFYQVKN